MKKALLLILTSWISILQAQISTSPVSIDFSNVSVGEVDSIEITFTNSYSESVGLNNFVFRTFYGDPVYYTKVTTLQIAPGSSESLFVYFEPEHNMEHHSQFILNSDYRGAVTVDVQGDGRLDLNYYSSTFNKAEEDLKTALSTLLGNGYDQLSYNNARDNMYATLDNTGGQVECAYTGRTASFNTRPGANANSFNCEHTWPQSFFNSNLPERSDIHHLFPTDVNANSQRGNLPFGEVSGNPDWQEGGSKKGGGKFEPRDAQKGRTARAMMYFVLRYGNLSGFFTNQESILRHWHNQFVPNADERQRNNGIYNLQNNRNPFVDFPKFIERISSLSGNSVAPENYDLYISHDTVNFNESTNDLEFTIALFNRGNQPIELSNFNFSSSAYSFSNSVGTETIQPGEALELKITTDASLPQGSEETLTFETDVPGLAVQLIHLLGGWPASSVQTVEYTDHTIYPNPVHNEFVINGMAGNFELFNLQGSRVKTCSNPCNVSDLSPGLYLIRTASQQFRLVVD